MSSSYDVYPERVNDSNVPGRDEHALYAEVSGNGTKTLAMKTARQSVTSEFR